jgi:hypothetical protein
VSRFDPTKLHVTYAEGYSPDASPHDAPLVPRRYTLTHSDATGDLFLTVGSEYDTVALTTFQVRTLADEVVGEWVEDPAPRLVVHCRAQGGLAIIRAKTRVRMFHGHMPMTLVAMHYGDGAYLEAHPELDAAPVEVWFHYRHGMFGRRRGPSDEREQWGRFGDYAR